MKSAAFLSVAANETVAVEVPAGCVHHSAVVSIQEFELIPELIYTKTELTVTSKVAARPGRLSWYHWSW